MVRDKQYEASRKRLLTRMKKGFDLGIRDRRVPWSRDELMSVDSVDTNILRR